MENILLSPLRKPSPSTIALLRLFCNKRKDKRFNAAEACVAICNTPPSPLLCPTYLHGQMIVLALWPRSMDTTGE